MEIVDFNQFLEFAEDMTTKYKFYRVINDKLQCYMFGRDGITISSETNNSTTVLIDIQKKGFIETKLTDEEIDFMGLKQWW